MKKVLVIGAAGKVGKFIMQHLGDQAIGCYRRDVENGIQLDLETDRIYERLPNPEAISHAIILAGIVNPAEIVADPAKAREINVDATWQLVEDLMELNITPIFTSSDALLGPGSGPFSETDPVDPTVLYGILKLEIERQFLQISKNWLVLRLSRIYGIAVGDGSFITNLYAKIIAGGKVPVAADQLFTPLYGGDLGPALGKAINSNLTGVYHLGGDEAVTHADIAELIYGEISKHRPLEISFERKSINDFVSYETRPTDISMNSSKIKKALNLSFMGLSDAAQRIVQAGLKTR